MTFQQNSDVIPDDELWEYKECFYWFAKDGSGYITGQDLPVAVRAMGQYWTFADLRALIHEFPPSSQISFQEFLDICSRKYGKKPDISELERSFEVWLQKEEKSS